MDNEHQLNEVPMSFFPSLPLIRTRGCYEMDNKKPENHCTKNYISHKKLTADIFTEYCLHGKYLIKLNFQVDSKLNFLFHYEIYCFCLNFL